MLIETMRENGKKRVQLECLDESKVEQSHRDRCDINSMVAKARRGTFVPPSSPGVYGDFTGITDFQTAHNRLLAAEATFFALPAKIRERFQNDPAAVIAFVDDPANAEECYSLGLLERPKRDKGTVGPKQEETAAEAAVEPQA